MNLTPRALALKAALVALVAAIVGLAALALSASQPSRYEATTRLAYGIVLRPDLQVLGIGVSDGTSDAVRLNTASGTVNSYDIAVRTAREAPDLGLTPDEVDQRVEATPEPDTQIVALTASESTPERAARLARVYRDQYLLERRQIEAARAMEAERALRNRLRGLPRSQRDGELAATLRMQLGALAVLRRTGSGVPQMVQDVRRPTDPVEPKTRRNVVFGVLFGLALGVGLVALRPRRIGEG